jgi:formate hydrogenlyase subunit 3/multisubunit Na+/H+ antiporter MnhD subunit
MRIIKAIMVIALLILAVSVFLYMNNTDNTSTNTSTGDTSPQVDKDKEINQEHKIISSAITIIALIIFTNFAQMAIEKLNKQQLCINQDDKDSVVESNRLLLNKLHALESKLKDLKDNHGQ